MSRADEAAVKAGASDGRGKSFRWVAIGILLLLVAASGGGAYWYFFLAKRVAEANTPGPAPAAPLPFYLEIKPFVVSMADSAGTPHLVQLGLSLTVSGTDAANVVNGVLPEVQDGIRQTLLNFKVSDIVTPAGVEKMREATMTKVNQVLLQRLGAERVKQLNGGEANGGVVQAVYFSTLIVE